MSQLRRAAIISPYSWATPHPVNDHVREVAAGLAARGLDPLVLAPSSHAQALRETRRTLRQLGRGVPPADALNRPALRDTAYGGAEVTVLAVGVPIGEVSVTSRFTVRHVLDHADVDLLYCVDPLTAGLSRAIVRRAGRPVIAGFLAAGKHGVGEPTPRSARILDYVDAGVSDSPDLQSALGHVRPDDAVALMPVVAPRAHAEQLANGHENVHKHAPESGPTPAWDRLVVVRSPGDERLVRVLLRTVAAAGSTAPEVVLVTRWARSRRPSVPRVLRGRVRTERVTRREDFDALLAEPGTLVIGLGGLAERTRLEAAAAGVPAIDCVNEASVAALLAAGPAEAVMPQVSQLVGDAAEAVISAWNGLQLRPQPSRVPVRREATCVIDLHMHTDHSYDCATDPEALLWAAERAGLTAIAVTDHNEVSGAQACARMADEYNLQVIIGEEVMTTEGEVIGLFLQERIPEGLSWDEAIAAIRSQGGIVYVPHPFDRMHTIPSASTLRRTVHEIDVLEVHNGRLAFEQYNRDAAHFASRYNLLRGAGSDAHVVQSLGSAAVRMPAFAGPEEFLASLQQGEILTDSRSYAYVQSLKFLQNKTPLPGRSAPER